jgi:hypothetical protein
MLVAWFLAMVAPATAVAIDTATVVPAEVCPPDSTMGCDPTHKKHTVTVDPETGDIIETTRTCKYKGIIEKPREDGGADVFCNYGACGLVQI